MSVWNDDTLKLADREWDKRNYTEFRKLIEKATEIHPSIDSPHNLEFSYLKRLDEVGELKNYIQNIFHNQNIKDISGIRHEIEQIKKEYTWAIVLYEQIINLLNETNILDKGFLQKVRKLQPYSGWDKFELTDTIYSNIVALLLNNAQEEKGLNLIYKLYSKIIFEENCDHSEIFSRLFFQKYYFLSREYQLHEFTAFFFTGFLLQRYELKNYWLGTKKDYEELIEYWSSFLDRDLNNAKKMLIKAIRLLKDNNYFVPAIMLMNLIGANYLITNIEMMNFCKSEKHPNILADLLNIETDLLTQAQKNEIWLKAAQLFKYENQTEKAEEILRKVANENSDPSPKTCPCCNSEINTNAKFCSECGHKLIT